MVDSLTKVKKYIPKKIDTTALKLNKRRSQMILIDALGTGSEAAQTSQSVRRFSQVTSNTVRRLSNSALGTSYEVKKLQDPLLET
mmetsp:Transcript_98314/g.179595  ORF Transcript_98314/g.179595 Transcript_98314/m.179595 type:complete len:85 (-) Transcript_98314:59-313(-)